MTGTEYQRLAMRTKKENMTKEEYLIEGCLGLAGEAGEVCDYIKKHIYQGHEMDYNHVAEEISDVHWYTALTATAIGWDLNDIMEMNIEKLKKRYPEGFSVMNSINRKKKKKIGRSLIRPSFLLLRKKYVNLFFSFFVRGLIYFFLKR